MASRWPESRPSRPGPAVIWANWLPAAWRYSFPLSSLCQPSQPMGQLDQVESSSMSGLFG